MQSNSSNPPVMSPPTSVTLRYSTPDGDFEVSVDPQTVGAVVWDQRAANAMANVRTQPGQNPPGVTAQRTTSSNTLSTASTTSTVPPSCYWVGGQLVCC